MYIFIIALFIGTFFSCFGAATSGHDANQELLDAIYTLEAEPHGISYVDFMNAKLHQPLVATTIRRSIKMHKGSTELQLQSSSVSIGNRAVITCFVAGRNLEAQLRRIKPDCVNIAYDLARSISVHWLMHIKAQDILDTSKVYVPNGKFFRLALFNAHFAEFEHTTALYIVSSRKGATAYFMKPQPRIDIDTVSIAQKGIQWLGKELAAAMAKQRQVLVLQHPCMKILTASAAVFDDSTFDYIFDVDGKAIADYFAAQTTEVAPEPKRQRRA